MFITIEGTEGSGKSTLIKALKSSQNDFIKPVLFTREPGGSPIGGLIRKILLEGEKLSAMAELFLFLADRAEHVQMVIRPHLENHGLVICDRFTDSTLAYQGYARELDVEQLRLLNHHATGGLRPDLTIFMNIKPEESLKRCLKNDRMDKESIEFHQKVYEGFLLESKKDPQRWFNVDATLSEKEISTMVTHKIISMLV